MSEVLIVNKGRRRKYFKRKIGMVITADEGVTWKVTVVRDERVGKPRLCQTKCLVVSQLSS